MAKLVSKTYGDALFELAVEENKVDELSEEVLFVRELLDREDELNRLMNHPKIIKEEKLEMLQQIFDGRISKELMGFLTIVLTKDRYGELEEILDYFLAEGKRYKGIGIATVTTAVELSEEQKKRIEQKLSDTTEFRSMEMIYRTDASLIGGMIIRIGDRVVDSSIRTKLSKLQRELLKTQIS